MKVLFLDRDGVINIENEGSYILNLADFKFYEGVLGSLAELKNHFDKIIVVTNQRCVGKGLLSISELQVIHDFMMERIEKNGGKIDKIYFAPAIENDDEMRKPNIGMGIQSKKDFPEIDFEQSVMVGNNISDMQFGKKLGMKTIFLHTTRDPQILPHEFIDEQYPSLAAFTQKFQSIYES